MATQWITSEGLQIPTLSELQTQLNERRRGDVDPLLATDSDSLAGETAAIEASHLREAWEALQVAFSAINPDNAEDAILDGVTALTGTLRDPATYSRLAGTRRATVNLEDGATVTAGVFVAHVAGQPTNRWIATENVTNNTGVTGDFAVAFRSETTGPNTANAGTLTSIATITSGVNSITNAFDATAGHVIEDDGSLRLRQQDELRAAGSCSNPTLRANLLQYLDADGAHAILSCEILENTGDTTDANGIAPHSWEVLVWDGPGAPVPNEDIAAIVAEHRPLGSIEQGGTSATATITKNGSEYTTTAYFTRPTEIAVSIEVNLKKTAAEYVGNDAVKALLVSTGAAEQKPSIGGASGVVAFSDYLASAWSAGGVTRVTSIAVTIPGSAPVTNADAEIPPRSIAVVSTANVTVNATDET